MIKQGHKEEVDWLLNTACAVVTAASAFLALGGALFVIFWGGLFLGIFTKSRRIRWAALTSSITALVTVCYFLR